MASNNIAEFLNKLETLEVYDTLDRFDVLAKKFNSGG